MEVFAEQAIYTPYSLPMYREDGKMGGKFKLSHVMRRNRYDPSKMQVLSPSCSGVRIRKSRVLCRCARPVYCMPVRLSECL